MRKIILFLMAIILLPSLSRSQTLLPISYGMAHNDYEHKRPLFDALDIGIRCVEVDVLLKENTICVAHSKRSARIENNFEALYLKPLKDLIEKNNGAVFPEKQQFYIYLNPKTGGETFRHLCELLEKYKSILARVDVEGYHPGPVKIMGIGWGSMKDQEVRYLFSEGNSSYLDSDLPGTSVFMINGKWNDFFSWKGRGEMPIDEELQLREMVSKAHKKDRILRFWHTPDRKNKRREAVWNKLLNCGVDFINTDDLEGLGDFHQRNNKLKKIKEVKTTIIFRENEGEFHIDVKGKPRLGSGKLNFSSPEIGDKDAKIYTKLLSDNILIISGLNMSSKQVSFGFNEIPELKEGVAAYLFGDWESWTKPARFESVEDFPKEKVEFALWKYEDGMYGAMIPMIDENYVSMLGSDGTSIAAFPQNFSKTKSKSIPLMIVGFDDDPYRLVADIYEKGLKAMGKENNLRKYKDYPKAFEQLTWCTWNAMYEEVSAEKIIEGIKTFRDKGITVPTLLIDDGWLEVSSDEKLRSFEFDQKKFPNGAATVIKELKDNYGIQNVGVWHTMNGYWAGIDPKGALFKTEKDNLIAYRDKKNVHDLEWSDDIYYAPSPYGDKAYNFYNNWYSYLASQGIDFVKVDQQSVIKRIAKGQKRSEEALDFGAVAKNLELSLQKAVRKNFDGQIINCQDMATEALYNMGSSAVIRNSDDFFPDRTAFYSIEVEKGNAAAHVVMNIHNSLWASQIAWPDYDMFQSHHIDAEYHAILRAISGGPVFLSDKSGMQNAQIIKKLCLASGEIIRADQPGKPTKDCLFLINGKEPLKAFSTINNAGLLAIWNSDDADLVEGNWSPSDVEGLEGNNFIAYEHISKTVLSVTKHQRVPISLKRKEFQYWNVIPLKNKCAVIGLLDKYNAPGTVIASVSNPGELMTSIKGSGKLGIVIPVKPKKIIVNGEIFEGAWNYKNTLLTIGIIKQAKVDQTNILVVFSK